jgi:hypothetical protein
MPTREGIHTLADSLSCDSAGGCNVLARCAGATRNGAVAMYLPAVQVPHAMGAVQAVAMYLPAVQVPHAMGAVDPAGQ